MLLLVPFIAILVEVFATHTVSSDLTGWGAYIGSVAGLLASAGITKAWSEKMKGNNNGKFCNRI